MRAPGFGDGLEGGKEGGFIEGSRGVRRGCVDLPGFWGMRYGGGWVVYVPPFAFHPNEQRPLAGDPGLRRMGHPSVRFRCVDFSSFGGWNPHLRIEMWVTRIGGGEFGDGGEGAEFFVGDDVFDEGGRGFGGGGVARG